MKRIAFALVVIALMGIMSGGAVAQDASPPATASLLAGLGYPELVITTDGVTNDLPAELAAGRYHVVVHNTNATNDVEVDFFTPPDGVTQEEAIALYKSSETSGPLPDEVYQLTIAGGFLGVGSGSTGEAIIDLPPGDWYVGIEVVNEDAPNEGAAHPLTVTGTMPELSDPAGATTITLADLTVDMPDTLPAGPQIVKVTNAGSMLHFAIISRSDEPLTVEQVQATFGSFIGTPMAADATPLPFEAISDVGNSGVLSAGQSMWLELDLQPGQYLVACFMEGPGDVPLHAAMGMFTLFTVE